MTGARALWIDSEPVGRTQLDRAATRLASELRAVGAGPGTPILAPSETCFELVAACAAARALGAPIVLGQSKDRGISAIASVERGHDGGMVVAFPGTRPPRLPDDVTAILWTSGTTGAQKAVALTYAGLRYQVAATRARLELDADDRLVVTVPLSHAYGFSILEIWRTFSPALHVETIRRPAVVVRRILDTHATSLDAVPSLYALLLRRARTDRLLRDALGRLRVRGCGGDVLPTWLAAAFEDVVGAPIHDGYGLTEAGPNVALTGPSDHRAGTVGRPLDGTRIRVDASTREVLVRSPSVTCGYVDGSGALEPPPLDGEWLPTGDVGRIDDDGYLAVDGRLKHVIIVHGENFSPSVVEDALRGCGGVDEACAVAVRSGKARGDDVVAFVERSCEGAPDDLREACRRALPPELRPRVIRVVSRLPRLSSGKPDRSQIDALARTLLRHVGSAVGG